MEPQRGLVHREELRTDDLEPDVDADGILFGTRPACRPRPRAGRTGRCRSSQGFAAVVREPSHQGPAVRVDTARGHRGQGLHDARTELVGLFQRLESFAGRAARDPRQRQQPETVLLAVVIAVRVRHGSPPGRLEPIASDGEGLALSPVTTRAGRPLFDSPPTDPVRDPFGTGPNWSRCKRACIPDDKWCPGTFEMRNPGAILQPIGTGC
jgi:hypothetical protein